MNIHSHNLDFKTFNHISDCADQLALSLREKWIEKQECPSVITYIAYFKNGENDDTYSTYFFHIYAGYNDTELTAQFKSCDNFIRYKLNKRPEFTIAVIPLHIIHGETYFKDLAVIATDGVSMHPVVIRDKKIQSLRFSRMIVSNHVHKYGYNGFDFPSLN